MSTETLHFGADVSRLLDIVANALYSHDDVFIRELISNASDACDRLRYEAIEKPALIKDDPGFRIRLWRDTDARTLTILDNGVGMTRQELIDNLGTIAKSGTAALMEQMRGGKDPLKLIGQFGVGFYASFMVADKASVISRRAGEAQTWVWESDGRTGFSVREASADEAKILSGGRGTAITLFMKDDASDFLIEDKITLVIQRYSDHINVPIYVGRPPVSAPEAADEKPVNLAAAIWMRPKSEVTKDQYDDFYKHISMGYGEPALTSHWKAEGAIEYSALIYVPMLRPWDMYDGTRKHAVKLYVRRVFISDSCEGLVYPWLRFLRGVIDSEDLPLNISRETLQHNPVISKIRRGVAKRVLGDLYRLSQDDPEAFTAFWLQFGAVVKEGIYDAHELRPDIFKITRFYSTHGGGKELVSLEDYVSRMKDGQEAIYYISGPNAEGLMNSPQLEGFCARGIEVLFFTDTIDDFWLQTAGDYGGKPFKSVTKGSIDLTKFAPEQKNKDGSDEKKTDNPDVTALVGALAGILKDEIGKVRVSQRLTDSPVCLVADENEVDMNLERTLKLHQHYDGKSKRVLEINPDHPLVGCLSGLVQNPERKPELENAAHLLLDQARIIQGEPLPDPAGFARRMADFMERGLAS